MVESIINIHGPHVKQRHQYAYHTHASHFIPGITPQVLSNTSLRFPLSFCPGLAEMLLPFHPIPSLP